MSSQKSPDTVSKTTLLMIALEDGRLVLNAKFPIRWILISISFIATASGYPALIQIVTQLLHIE